MCFRYFIQKLGFSFSEGGKGNQLGRKLRHARPQKLSVKQHEPLDDSQMESNASPNGGQRRRRRRRPRKPRGNETSGVKESVPGSTVKKQHDAPMQKRDLYFCLRCGLVGIGPSGSDSAVGRVTIVNWDNEVVLDNFIKVPVPVTNYRSESSGVTEADLKSKNAITFDKVRSKVQSLIKGKILIGHGLEVDLSALGLAHPWCDVRDTASFTPYMKEVSDPLGTYVLPRDLPGLFSDILHREAPRCPVQAAIGCLDLYKASRNEWETELIQLVQLKEQQRKMVLSMRASGAESYPMCAPLSSINEIGYSGHPQGMPPFIMTDHGPPVSYCSELEFDDLSTNASTDPTTIRHNDDNGSDLSSFISGRSERRVTSPAYPVFGHPQDEVHVRSIAQSWSGSAGGNSHRPLADWNVNNAFAPEMPNRDWVPIDECSPSRQPMTKWSHEGGVSPNRMSYEHSMAVDAISELVPRHPGLTMEQDLDGHLPTALLEDLEPRHNQEPLENAHSSLDITHLVDGSSVIREKPPRSSSWFRLRRVKSPSRNRREKSLSSGSRGLWWSRQADASATNEIQEATIDNIEQVPVVNDQLTEAYVTAQFGELSLTRESEQIQLSDSNTIQAEISLQHGAPDVVTNPERWLEEVIGPSQFIEKSN